MKTLILGPFLVYQFIVIIESMRTFFFFLEDVKIADRAFLSVDLKIVILSGTWSFLYLKGYPFIIVSTSHIQL